MKRYKNARNTSFLIGRLIAHRGLHNIEKGIAENSIPAFEKSIENNYIIELDVHILKDRNVVVFHDDNLKRMTGIDKEIKNMTYEDVKELRLQNTYQTIPLLTEVLNLINGKVPVIIELKCDVKRGILEKEVINILRKYKGEYAIKSFDPLRIFYFRNHFTEGIRGILISDLKNKKCSKFKKTLLKSMIFNIICKPDFISCDIRLLPNKKIDRIRRKMIILSWTIKNKYDLEKSKKYSDNSICEKIIG